MPNFRCSPISLGGVVVCVSKRFVASKSNQNNVWKNYEHPMIENMSPQVSRAQCLRGPRSRLTARVVILVNKFLEGVVILYVQNPRLLRPKSYCFVHENDSSTSESPSGSCYAGLRRKVILQTLHFTHQDNYYSGVQWSGRMGTL